MAVSKTPAGTTIDRCGDHVSKNPCGDRVADPCGDRIPTRHRIEVTTWHRVSMIAWCEDEIPAGAWEYQVLDRTPEGFRCGFSFDQQDHAVLFRMVWC